MEIYYLLISRTLIFYASVIVKNITTLLVFYEIKLPQDLNKTFATFYLLLSTKLIFYYVYIIKHELYILFSRDLPFTIQYKYLT